MAPNNEENQDPSEDENENDKEIDFANVPPDVEVDEDGVTAAAHSLLEMPADVTNAVSILCNGKRYTVSLEAKDAMSVAIDASSNRPTVWFRMDYVVKAACKILDIDYHEHLMPQEDEDLKAFDWSKVIVGVQSTYPKGIRPTKEEFALVSTVYELEKSEKDKKARSVGQPKSSVQSCITFKQRWQQLRDLMAVCRHLEPDDDLQMVYDFVMFRVKLKSSIKKIYEESVDVDLHKHLAKMNSGKRKAEREKKVQDELEQAKKAKQHAKQEAARLAQEGKAAKNRINAVNNKKFQGSRSQVAAKRKVERTQWKKAEQEANAEAREQKKRAKKIEKEEKQLEKQAAAIRDEPDAMEDPAKKKLKRNEVSLLEMTLTPRKKVELGGAAWKPPTRKDDVVAVEYDQPGAKWRDSNLHKLKLLMAISREMQSEGLIPQRVTFSGLMEHIEGTATLEFNTRVFLYLVGLIVYRRSTFEGMVNILLHFFNNEMLTPAAVIAEDEKEGSSLATIIGDIDGDAQASAPTVLKMCKELVKDPYNGVIPSSPAALEAVGLHESVSTPLLQRVFGCTGLHCGLNLRKLVCAVDLYDWEAAGVLSKLDLKMTKVPAAHVQKSMLTWVPQGERLAMQDLLEELAFAIGSRKQGFWGQCERMAKRHTPKDKKILMDAATDIARFYKAVKSGGKAR